MEKAKHSMDSVVAKKYPVAKKGQGMYVYDADGKEYIDCAAAIGVTNIGHGVKEIADAVQKQMNEISFVYGGTFTTEARQRLADQIIEMAPANMDKVFFCSGGSEAMESVLKIARQYQLEKGNASKYKIISRWQSYHGNTIATLSIGGRPSWRTKYNPYLLQMPHVPQCNCYRCPLNLSYPSCKLACAEELERTICYEGPETVAAFVLEPVIGTTAAATFPAPGYLKRVREICDKYDVLMCADEVITGFGRTGKPFAVQLFDVEPDLIGIAKGLASGYAPIGGVIVSKKVVSAFENGSGQLVHSFTYSGHPVSCAAASAVLKYMKDNNLIENNNAKGELFLKKLKTLEELPMVGEVRGKALMLGMELVKDKATKEPYPASLNVAGKISAYCFNKGVMITAGVSGTKDGLVGDSMQIAPPFVIEEKEMDVIVATLKEAILAVYEEVK